MFFCCCRYVEIDDEQEFSEVELHEIKQLLYCDKDEEGEWNEEEEDEEDEEWCEDRMEANEWSIADTYYGFQCGCTLKPVDEWGGGHNLIITSW